MRRWIEFAVTAIALSCAGESSSVLESGPLVEEAPIHVVREVAVAYDEGATDFLFRPTDVAQAGDTLFIVDNGNDRIVILDTAFNVLQAIGREGEGPGEFASPVSVRVTAREIIVAEINNGRFSIFDRNGTFVRTIPSIVPTVGFGVDSRGGIYQSGRSVTHHALRLSSAGEALFAPRRDTATGEEALAIQKTARESWVAITPGDTVHVFNDTDGTISKYSPGGTRLVTRELPLPVLDSLKADRLKLVNALAQYGVTELSGTLISDFVVTGDHQLLIGATTGNVVALLIDPVTYRARRIVIDPVNGPLAPLQTARALALRGNRLYAVSGDQLYAYELDLGASK